MSVFVEQNLGTAASVFLAIYTVYTPFMCYVVFRKGIMTVYGFLFFFAVIRFAGQLCGVVYAKLGPEYWRWLIAYLVLGAVGYFALILAAFHTTCKGQRAKFGSSWLTENGPPRCLSHIPVVGAIISKRAQSWAALFKLATLPANILVIIGATDLTSVIGESPQQQASLLNQSKVLRTVGQSMFLGSMFVAVLVNQYVMWVQKVRNIYTRMAFAAAPFFLVRGVFGVMSIYIPAMNYFDVLDASSGFKTDTVIYDYVLGTTTELVGSALLVLTWLANEGPEVDSGELLDSDFSRKV